MAPTDNLPLPYLKGRREIVANQLKHAEARLEDFRDSHKNLLDEIQEARQNLAEVELKISQAQDPNWELLKLPLGSVIQFTRPWKQSSTEGSTIWLSYYRLDCIWMTSSTRSGNSAGGRLSHTTDELIKFVEGCDVIVYTKCRDLGNEEEWTP